MLVQILRPWVLRYHVSGALDGVTPAPAFVGPPSPAAPLNADQEMVFEVENLGLVNLIEGGPNGQSADRHVKWIEVVGPNPPIGGDNVNVVFDGQLQSSEITIPPAANGVYSRNCIFVPQTAQLGLFNMVASPGEPILVRIGVWRAASLDDLNAIKEACCCKAQCVDMMGDPCFVQALFAQNVGVGFAMAGVAPGAIARASTERFTVTGTGFMPGMRFAIRQTFVPAVTQEPLKFVQVNSVNVVNDTTAQVSATAAADQPLGDYDLFAQLPLGGSLYRRVLPAAIEVTV